MQLLVTTLRQHAQRRGDLPAVTFAEFDRGLDPSTVTTWTYGELDLWARAVAAELQRRFQPGAHCAVICPQGLTYLAAFLGCLYAGMRAVPMQAPDAFRGGARLTALLADVEPVCLLTTSALLPATAQLSGVPAVAVDEIGTGSADAWREPVLTGETVAYVQYTSGSTSSPRGVLVTFANIAHTAHICDEAYGIGAHPVAVSWLPLFHDMGMAAGATMPLTLGRHAVLMAPFAFVQRPARWLRLIDRFRGTFSAAPNFALDMCAERVTPDEVEDVDLGCVKVLLNGSEPVRPGSLRRFAETFAEKGFKAAALKPSYGLAEATIIVTATPVQTGPRVLSCDRDALADGEVVSASDGRQIVSCGTPVGQQVRVVDPDTGDELPEGRVGEVWVSGPNVAAGYHGQPERTDAVFKARSVWLRTGDLGFFDGGHLYLVGRLKDLVVIGGRNHHPADIEAVVESTSPALRPGHVAAFSVDVGDAERLVIVAEAEPRAAREADPAVLRRAVRRVISAEHGVELHDFLLVRKGSLPKTSSGKLQRTLTRERYLDGVFTEFRRAAA